MDTNTYSKITQKQVLEHFKNHKTLFVRGGAKQVIYTMNKKGLLVTGLDMTWITALTEGMNT